MARQFNLPNVNETIESILLDENSIPILRVEAGEYEVHELDGSMTHRRVNNSILLMCGTEWHPGMWKEVPVGVCELCRHPRYKFPLREKPRHGIVSLARATRLCSPPLKVLIF